MGFYIIPTSELFDFIGLYIPMAIAAIVGACISKLIHNKIPAWITHVIGIVISIICIINALQLNYTSLLYKILVFIVLVALIAAFTLIVITLNVEKKETPEIKADTKTCPYCGKDFSFGTSCPKCGRKI